MASPLSNFIHFAANDCGYSGTRYDLIANWVHPLFLKAKSAASKEDNPNWSQAMRGPFKEEYWKAALKEIETLEQMDVWEVVDQTDGMNVIDSIWAFKRTTSTSSRSSSSTSKSRVKSALRPCAWMSAAEDSRRPRSFVTPDVRP